LLKKNEKTPGVMHNQGALIQIVRFCSVALTRNKRAFIMGDGTYDAGPGKRSILTKVGVKETLSYTFLTVNVQNVCS
jgi:hypothetical protein